MNSTFFTIAFLSLALLANAKKGLDVSGWISNLDCFDCIKKAG